MHANLGQAPQEKNDGSWWPFILIGGGVYLVFAVALARARGRDADRTFEAVAWTSQARESPAKRYVGSDSNPSKPRESTAERRRRNRRESIL